MIDRTSSTKEALAFLTRAPPAKARAAYEAQRRIAVEIVSADLPASLVVAARTGVKMQIHPASDFVTSRAFLVEGLYEAATHAFLKHALSPGDVYIDVGANIGTHVLPASRYVGELGAVIAIEPNPDMVRRLLANLRLNAAHNVRVLQVAAGDQSGAFKLVVHPYHPGNGQLVAESEATPEYLADLEAKIRANPHAGLSDFPEFGKDLAPEEAWQGFVQEVTMAPFSQLVCEYDAARAAVVKIDVEGAEMSVLRGGEFLWSRERPPCAIVEYEERAPGARAEIFNFFVSRGWRLFIVSCSAYGLPTYNEISEPYVAAAFENVFAAPPARVDHVLRGCILVPYDHAMLRAKYG
jgi:FkbM family methyltransferase